MISTISSGMLGINRALETAQHSAFKIASRQNQQNAGDLAAELANLKIAQRHVEANIQSVSAENDLRGLFVDIFK